MDIKAQTYLITIMLCVVVILLALSFTPVIKQFADDARNSTSDTQVGLDCANSSITKFDKANCVVVDTFNPYFTGFLIFLAGVLIGAKILFGNNGGGQ